MRLTKPRLDLVAAVVSQAGYKLLGFLILAMLARALAPDEYGLLMFALSLVVLAGWGTDLGASQELIRRVAAEPSVAGHRTSEVLSYRMPLLVAVLILVNVWVALTKPDAWWVVTAFVAYALGLEINRTVSGLCLGLRRVTDSIRIFGTGLLFLFVAVALGTLVEGGLPWMVGAYVLCGLVLALRSLWVARRTVGPLFVGWRARGAPRFFARTLPLLTLTAIGTVYLHVDTLMVGYLQPYREVARFEVAAKLFEASQFLVRPFVMVLFPICAGLAEQGRWDRLRRTLNRTLAGLVALGLVAALAVQVLADDVIRFVFTSTYDDSAEVLRVLFLGVCALYAATVANFVVASVHRDRLALLAMVGGLGLNVALNAWSVPTYGALGAAWSTVASLSVSAVALCFFAYRSVRSGAVQGARPARAAVEAASP